MPPYLRKCSAFPNIEVLRLTGYAAAGAAKPGPIAAESVGVTVKRTFTANRAAEPLGR